MSTSICHCAFQRYIDRTTASTPDVVAVTKKWLSASRHATPSSMTAPVMSVIRQYRARPTGARSYGGHRAGDGRGRIGRGTVMGRPQPGAGDHHLGARLQVAVMHGC